MNASVCVVGSFMMDLVAYAPRRPEPGETLVGTEFSMFVGGKGFNQAVAAARAGAPTTMIGSLGDDTFGREFLSFLAAEGIDSQHILRRSSLGTGVGLPVVEPSGQNSIIIVPQANTLMSRQHIEASAAAIEEADVLLIQLEIPIEASLAAATVARRSDTTVILNPAPGIEVPAAFRGLVDIVVPNEPEAAQMTGIAIEEFDPESVARVLMADWDLQAVVLTLGDKGALVTTGDGVIEAAPYAVTSVDSVGAGDAFCGALAAALAGGADLRPAVGYANAAGALSVTRRGGAPSAPTRAEIDALLETTRLPGENVS